MPDQNRFGKSSRSYAVDTPRERGIKAYNRNLREGLGSGRNVQRIRQARADRTLNRPPRWDQKLGRDVGTMVKDMTSPFKTAWMHGADLFAKGLGSLSQAEKARVGGKFNAPLNVKKGTNAYSWLLDHVIKDEYEDDFKKEVKKDNLYWTELNKYAKDKYIGGGQLARGINARNEGIIGTDKGKKAFTEATTIRDGDTPAIKEAIVTAITDTYPMENVTTTDIIEEPYGEEWDIDTSSYNLNPAVPVSRQGPLDTSPEEQELLMSLHTDPEVGDPRYREGPNPFVTPYVPMEGPSPVPLPPYLSGDTDWWTPEPEEEDLRGWDWINEPVMKHYGGGRPSEEIERVWPNTPPPGYGSPPWYSRAWDWMKEGPWPTY